MNGGVAVEPTPVKPEHILLLVIGVGILIVVGVALHLSGRL